MGGAVLDPSLFAFIAICFVAAMSGGIFRPGAWYETLRKPGWTPPKWAFPVVWSILYAMIAVAGWLVWHAAVPSALLWPMAIYGLQLILNASWSAVFFGMRRPDLALLNVGLLWSAIFANAIVFYSVTPMAGFFLVPYLIWVTIAACLNYSIWRLNPNDPKSISTKEASA